MNDEKIIVTVPVDRFYEVCTLLKEYGLTYSVVYDY